MISIYLSINQSTCLSINLSIYLPVYPSIYLSIYLVPVLSLGTPGPVYTRPRPSNLSTIEGRTVWLSGQALVRGRARVRLGKLGVGLG